MSASGEPCPALRYVEAVPFEKKGHSYYLIRDPLEFAAGPLIVPPAAFFILTRLDGRNNVAAIREDFAKQFDGAAVAESQVRELLEVLDRNYYLDSPRGRARADKILAEFRRAAVRPARHAGEAYEADPEELRRQLAGFRRDPAGTEFPDAPAGPPAARAAAMAPHIDLRVGGGCVTHAHRWMLERTRPELVVILGVSHFGGEDLVIATGKDFETPLGRVGADRDFLVRWNRAAGRDLAAEEFAHRVEHSVEFQLVFLQAALGASFNIMPVLCTSADEFLAKNKKPWTVPAAARAIEGLAAALAAEPRRVAVLVSVDLSHVGPKFGDDSPVTPAGAKAIEAADRRLLAVAETMDRDEFFEAMRRDGNARHWDAVTALLVMFSVMGKGRGKLLRYEQNFQKDTKSLVSYASMGFEIGTPGVRGMKRLNVVFRGFVQGVGFRWTTMGIARGFAVTGFVRNLPDGAVELVAEGTEDELARFLDGISAEMGSHIRDREISWTAPTGEFDGFRITR